MFFHKDIDKKLFFIKIKHEKEKIYYLWFKKVKVIMLLPLTVSMDFNETKRNSHWFYN